MEKVQLGKHGPLVSRICLGAGPLGVHGYGDVSVSEASEALQYAVEEGVNFIDCADVYGLGQAEERLGALFGKNPQVFLATKGGVRVGASGKSFFDSSPSWLESAAAASLKRLQREVIDLYYLHYWDRQTPLSAIFECAENLRAKGIIKYFGLSNIHVQDLPHAILPEWVLSAQLEYSLLEQRQLEHLQAWGQRHVTPLAYGVLAQGLLGGRYAAPTEFPEGDRRRNPQYTKFHGPEAEKNIWKVQQLRRICDARGCSVAAFSVRWVLDSLAGGVALVGVKNRAQAKDVLAAREVQGSSEMSDELMSII